LLIVLSSIYGLENFAGKSLLIAVSRPERSESPQGVAKIHRNYEFGIWWERDATIFYKIERSCVKAGAFVFASFMKKKAV